MSQTQPTISKPVTTLYEVTIDHPAIGRATIKLFAANKRTAGEMALAYIRKDKGQPTLSAIPQVREVEQSVGVSA